MKIFLALLLFIFALGTVRADPMPKPQVILDNHSPSPALLELLDECGIQHNGALLDIIEKTQSFWRQEGKERWEMLPLIGLHERRIYALLDRLHVLEEIPSPMQHFDYAIVHGALLPRVRMRIAFLIKEWKRGVRFDKIVFFTGERPLLSSAENEAALLDYDNRFLPISGNWSFNGALPTNEIQMMRFVFEQACLPEDMKKVPVEWVISPMIIKDGKVTRPNTQNNITEWLSRRPKPGSCLAISNQPYVGYQDAVLRKHLPTSYSLTTVGPQADGSTKLEVHLDNLARWLDQLK